MSGFCHLHLHTEYSLLEGACRLKDIPGAVAAAGQSAVAITDRGVMSGCAEFWRLCRENNIKPVIGCELPVISGMGDPTALPGTLVLLCENEEGYRNLCFISSHLTRVRGVFAAGADLLAGNSAGLIALSGGRDGDIFAALSAGDARKADALTAKYADMFGRDRFYIELQDHSDPVERQLLGELASLAQKHGLGMVATNDVHYLSPGDEPVQSALACIREGRTLDTGPGLPTAEYWLKAESEMERLFGGFPGAVENTGLIAARCSFEMPFGRTLLPSFPLPAGTSSGACLAALVESGLEEKTRAGLIPAEGPLSEEYRARAARELGVIASMGFDDYFLIVADYVGYAKRSDIPVGPGRGSACGSLVAYLLGITEVDPIKYGLFFERFLNPERAGMPDIDVDFDYNMRDRMIAYVRDKYGADRVAQIAAFGTLAARAAVRDAARVSGMGSAETDALCSLLPRDGDITVAGAAELPGLKKACESPKTAAVLRLAERLEGLPRSQSVHPAGVVIADRPLWDCLPLCNNGDAYVTQYDMDTVSAQGLLKFDFLALRNLSVIEEASKMIRATLPDFSVEKLDLTDSAPYRLISSGATDGIFQLESDGLKRIVTRMKPASIEDLTAAIALFRPGPIDSIEAYLKGREDPSSVSYLHPLLEPILRPTYGCIIYQEQVMSIFVTVAGYSLGRADLVRKAMSKKKASVLEAEREGFIKGALTRGLTPGEAGRLFDGMSSFAAYAFNKSHAVAYAILTYRTAWLKARRPGEFMTALLNSVVGSPEKIALYAAEAGKLGIRVRRPDVNSSGSFFEYRKGEIFFGLAAIKGVGYQVADAVVSGRKEGYPTLRDLISALPDRAAGRRPAEALIRSGALDSTGVFRSRMLAVLDSELSRRYDRPGGIEGQLDIFFDGDPLSGGATEYPDIPELSPEAASSGERETTGIDFGVIRRRATAGGDAHAPKAGETKSKASPEGGGRRPSAVYLRVASADSPEFAKAKNLAGIFEGDVPFFLFTADDRSYIPCGRIDASDYLLGELRALAGSSDLAVRYPPGGAI